MAAPVAAPVRVTDRSPPTDPSAHGITNPGSIHANLSPAVLTELVLARNEGILTDTGAVVVYTGKRTGRSPQDRFLVAEPPSKDAIAWGNVNKPMEPAAFNRLYNRVRAYFQNR